MGGRISSGLLGKEHISMGRVKREVELTHVEAAIAAAAVLSNN